MARTAIVCLAPRQVGFVSEADPAPGAGEVRLRTLYSGISSGTEMATYRGTSPYLLKRWDADRRLFVERAGLQAEVEPAGGYPVANWGYEEVGEIVEAGPGVEDLAPGTLVYGTWGHRTHHVAPAAWVRQRILPPGLDPLFGIFSHIGAVALNGVLDCAVRLGETVAVFGLGVVGQLVAQLLRLSGADVIGVDLVPARLEIARLGAIPTLIDGSQGSAAEQIKALTGGKGADLCVEASGSTAALNEAIRACAYNSRVVAMGFYAGEAHGLYLGDEFHHNRVDVVCSQISGQAPDLQHRWDRMRVVHTFMRLAAEGRLELRPLITHVVPATKAAGLYELIDRRPAEVMLAVLDFRGELSLSK